MTDEEMAEEWADKNITLAVSMNNPQAESIAKQAFLAGLKAGRSKWHKYSERPKDKINALCFDIEQNKFILGFYDLEADEWLRYGGYETIHIDLWVKIEIPEYTEE